MFSYLYYKILDLEEKMDGNFGGKFWKFWIPFWFPASEIGKFSKNSYPCPAQSTVLYTTCLMDHGSQQVHNTKTS
jgi:hypothetical protein